MQILRKITLWLSIMLSLSGMLSAQSIIGAEYFIDTDPGRGNGVSLNIMPGDSVFQLDSVMLQQMSPGFHYLYVRIQDSLGLVSTTRQPFYVDPLSQPLSSAIPGGPIVQAEYFIDTDPGRGNGVSLNIMPGDSVFQLDSVMLQQMSPGFHYLYVRIQDSLGLVNTTRQPFYVDPLSQPLSSAIPGGPIVQAEYFIDTDPGRGNGNSLNIMPGDSIFHLDSTVIQGISPGFHYLYVRTRDSLGLVNTTRQLFYVNPLTPQPPATLLRSNPITQTEYYFDTDPGVGNAIPLLTSSIDSVDIDSIISIAGLDTGQHELIVRVIDSVGFSQEEAHAFYVYRDITIDPRPSYEFNLGEQVHIPFTPTDTFKPGNTFTLQLSDPLGSFASPIDLGSLNGMMRDSILAQFPVRLREGCNQYQMRVVSTDPPVEGTPVSIAMKGFNEPDLDMALKFDGVNDFAVFDTGWFNYSEFTVSFWVKPDSQLYPHAYLLANLDTNGGFNWGVTQAVFAPGFYQYAPCNLNAWQNLEDSLWQYFTLTQSTSGNIQLYNFGQLIYEGACSPASYGANPFFALAMVIRSGGMTWFWRGEIDELSVHNRILSQPEILDQMRRGADISDSTLQGYWPFNTCRDDDNIIDESGNGRYGRLHNGVKRVVSTVPNIGKQVIPDKGGNNGYVSINLLGELFQPGALISLKHSSKPTIVADTLLVTPLGKEIFALFNLIEADTGLYDVWVENPDGTVKVYPKGFSIIEGGEVDLWVNVIGRNVLRRGRSTSFLVNYGNHGNANAIGVPLWVAIEGDSTLPISTSFDFFHHKSDTVTYSTPYDSIAVFLHPDSLFGEPFNGTVFPIYLPIVSAGLSNTLKFTVDGATTDLYITAWLSEPMFSTDTATSSINTGGNFRMSYSMRQGSKKPELIISADVVDCVIETIQTSLSLTGNLPASCAFTALDYALRPGVGFFIVNAIDGREEAEKYVKDKVGSLVWGWADVLTKCTPGGTAKVDVIKTLIDIITSHIKDFTNQLLIKPKRKGPPEELPDIPRCSFTKDALGGNGRSTSYGAGNAGRRSDIGCGGSPSVINTSPLPQVGGPTFDDVVSALGSPCLNAFRAIYFHNREIKVIGAYDPNEKVGPQGIGKSNFVRPDQEFLYTIFYENVDTATAAAQEVIILDTLDTKRLDISTFRFTGFGYNEVARHQPLQDQLSFTQYVQEDSFYVRIQGRLDTTTGVAAWRLTTVDSIGGGLTEDPIKGFLPPNINAPEGEGYVSYLIEPITSIQSGEVIENEATIIFDVNAPITTPVWKLTIDDDAPDSRIDTLAAIQRDTAFSVSWGGVDAHCGIRFYDILYSVNNDTTYKYWLYHTDTTDFTFVGEVDSLYHFFCLATDSLGNQESKPLAFEARTRIVPVLPRPNVTALSDTIVCYGDSVIIRADSGYANYRWNTGDTTQTIVVKRSGNFRVIGGDSLGLSSASRSVAVTVYPLPLPVISSSTGSFAFCEGDSLVLKAASGFLNYEWSDGQSDSLIVVNATSNYQLQVIDSNSCVSLWTDTVRVQELALPPKPQITAAGPLTFCDGDSVELLAPVPYCYYAWSSGDSLSSIWVKQSQSLTVAVIDSNFCASPLSDTLEVNVLARPPKPDIIPGPGQDELQSTVSGISYQWFRNDSLLAGFNTQTITGDRTGVYHVITFNDNCPSDTSEGFSFLKTSLEDEFKAAGFKLFPNPNDGLMTIEGPMGIGKEIKLQVVNATGQQVWERVIQPLEEPWRELIDVREVASGTYWLWVEVDGRRVGRGFVKE